jgi:L-cysteine desulfidase
MIEYVDKKSWIGERGRGLMMEKSVFLKIMEKELVVALGCTEPVTFAYAAALAREQIPAGTIERIVVKASVNMIKNAAGVIIPGTGLSGIELATALGAIVGRGEKKLEVLEGINSFQIETAQEMVRLGQVSVSLADTSKKLLVQVEVFNSEGGQAEVTIADEHTQVVQILCNGETVFRLSDGSSSLEEGNQETDFDLEDIWEFIHTADIGTDLEIVRRSIELNTRIGQEGLAEEYGFQVGRRIRNYVEKGIYANDMASYAMTLAAAASDARMAGCPTPVMSNTGSGNQGITATLPVVAIAERLEASQEDTIRAVAISHLVTIYIKYQFGRLSALCGAAVAATGASCGIVYLLGGKLPEIRSAIQNMIANVTGMLCDGAKIGCALKVSTCTQAAVQGAILALEGVDIREPHGILGGTAEESVSNLGRLAREGTTEADLVVLDIMLNRVQR